jgi:hypothetical protein
MCSCRACRRCWEQVPKGMGSRRQKGAAYGHLREHRGDREADRGGVCVPLRLRERPQVELRHRRDPQGVPGARRRGDDLPASPLGAESKRRALCGHRLRPAPPAGATRPTRAVPSRLSYALGAVPEGTRVTNTVELELHGPGRLLGESPCHVSGTPSPPTSGSSRNCWSNRGTPGRGFTPAARSCS